LGLALIAEAFSVNFRYKILLCYMLTICERFLRSFWQGLCAIAQSKMIETSQAVAGRPRMSEKIC